MNKAIQDQYTSQVSLTPIINPFWSHLYLNIYTATVPDRMHHCDLGLFKYQLTYTRKLLLLYGEQNILQKMDIRFGKILRYPGLHIFQHGLGNIKRFTASEYRDIIKVAIFCVDGLLKEIDVNLDKQLTNLFVLWNNMYILSQEENPTELYIEEFKKSRIYWAHEFIHLLQQFSPSDLRLPKLHSWLYHIDHTIREFGPLNGLCTETYESLHKYYVKASYRRSNKRNINSQLLKNDITTFIQQFHSNDKVNSDELKLGMYHLKDCLDLWLNEISKLLNINTEFETLSIIIEIYNAVKLTNGDWVRATEKFNNQKEYSNVAIQWKISSEIELVFGQIYQLVRIIL
ncbi:hypothetical protein RhiirA5_383507 [Rhizophagus irregularis]|uniref:Uncharacterized protein n=1 Tax=Rhizophagus irregularis TaxID=588596 RepID=A0A2N0NWR1_9GLOM|nr:hypothetical protein RhiirA5_383507 [Rhizophagus irregularis]